MVAEPSDEASPLCTVGAFANTKIVVFGETAYLPGPAKLPELIYQSCNLKTLQDLECPKPVF